MEVAFNESLDALLREDPLYEPFVDRQKEIGCRAYAYSAYDRADPDRTAQEKAAQHKGQIHKNTDDAEALPALVTDDHGHQVIGAGSGIRFDHDGHPVGQDHASKSKDKDLVRKRTVFRHQRLQQSRKQIDDGTAEDHTKNSADFDITAICEQEHENDQKTECDMYPAVGEYFAPGHGVQCPVHTLYQYIVGV